MQDHSHAPRESTEENNVSSSSESCCPQHFGGTENLQIHARALLLDFTSLSCFRKNAFPQLPPSSSTLLLLFLCLPP